MTQRKKLIMIATRGTSPQPISRPVINKYTMEKTHKYNDYNGTLLTRAVAVGGMK